MPKQITKQQIVETALQHGLDLVGVANIERFENAPKRMHPASIFPECRSVIAVARRILRGNWRGIEEGTYWPGYTYFGYHGLLNSVFIPVGVYETACFIEDAGWEAVPYYPGVPEAQPPDPPLRPGAVAPNVHFAIRLLATAAGLGEPGWAKVFLTRKFGPRVRLAAILTDLELEPDPLVEPGTLCDRCMSCVEGCQADAIPHVREGKTVRVQIEDKVYEWADLRVGRCVLGYHGGDPQVSPFLHKTLPGWEFDVTNQDVNEDVGYRLCWPMSLGSWRRTDEDPSGHLVDGHRQLADWGVGGSYGIGGSRGCMRSCFDHKEAKGSCEQTYRNGRFIKRERWLLPKRCGAPIDGPGEGASS
jgi:epoxyqueuosine reductase